MLINGVGRVFVGKRIDVIEVAWQMPQGGIDGDEKIRFPRNRHTSMQQQQEMQRESG